MDSTSTEPSATASPAPPGSVERAVVLVHGIGSQERGTVLAGWGGAITGWLEAADGVGATVVRTGGGDGPMWADVVVEHDGGAALRLRLIEALWADVVRPPSFVQLLVWAGKILPVAVVHHITAIFATYTRRIGAGVRSDRWLDRLVALLRILAAPALGVALIVLTGALTPLVILVLVVSLVLAALGSVAPVAAKAAGVVQRTLTGTLGDTTYLLTNPVQAAYVHQRIIDAIDHAVAATGAAERVTVLAHSQGAAATHGALLRGPAERPVDLITVGQGLAKIDRLREATADRLAVLPSIGMPITAVTAYLVARAGLVEGLADAGGLVLAATVPPVVVVLLGGAVVALLGSGGSGAARRRIEQGLSALSGVEVRLGSPEEPQPWTPAPTPEPAPDSRTLLAQRVPGLLTTPQPTLLAQLIGSVRPLLLSGILAAGAAAVGAVGSWLGRVASLPDEVPLLLIILIDLLLITTLTTVVVLWSNAGAHQVAWPAGVRSWLDLWASADPVANGPLAMPRGVTPPLATGRRRFETREVVNHHSAVLDHNGYQRNAAQVLALVMDRVLPDSWDLQVVGSRGRTSPVDVVTDATERCRRLAAALWLSRLAGWVALPVAVVVLPSVRVVERLAIERWVQLPAWAPMADDVDRLVVAVGVALAVWLALSALSRRRILGDWTVRIVPAPSDGPTLLVDVAAAEATEAEPGRARPL
jgi:hypothetical protein